MYIILNAGIGYYIPHMHVATCIHYMISVVDIRTSCEGEWLCSLEKPQQETFI